MKLKSLFNKIFRPTRNEPEFTDDLVINLIHRLEITHDDELSCDELFALIDEYAEANISREEAEKIHPLIVHHLDMCRECDEEYEALLNVLNEKTTQT